MAVLSLRQQASNFKEFYSHYLISHSRPLCRRLHVVGTVIGTFMTVIGLATLDKLLAIAGIMTGLAISVGSDLTVQKIWPTIMEHPVWTVHAEYQLVADTVKGKSV